MTNNETENGIEGVCNFKYLTELMGNKKHLIKGIIDAFLVQVPEELARINEAMIEVNYPVLKSLAHTMKSSVSIMGITVLAPILKEIEGLSRDDSGIERIKELGVKLNLLCKQAIAEIEGVKHLYS